MIPQSDQSKLTQLVTSVNQCGQCCSCDSIAIGPCRGRLCARIWQSLTVIQPPPAAPPPDTRWLTVPELVEVLGIGVSRVRRLIEDRALLATRVDGVWRVPELFIRDGEPLVELKGTLIVLADSGYSDEEMMQWILRHDESLNTSPIEALRAGRKAEVRRVAQALGF